MMLKIRFINVLLLFYPLQAVISQVVEIDGEVKSKADVENVHVINMTAKLFTITNEFGRFKISARPNDTLVFSSVLYQPKEVVVNEEILIKKRIEVVLEEKINQLDEVVVGKVLTGDLLFDIENTQGEPPINFYDVGIPGYTGKPATQSERRLNEASTGSNGQKIKWYSPLTGSIPLNPIINAITGRTKMLKQRIEIEDKEGLMLTIKARLSKDFFASNPLDEELKMDFFYFCADDKNFMASCKNQTDFKILIFLRMKYRQYLENLKTDKD